AHAVDKAVTGGEHAVVDEYPAFRRLDGDWAGADLCALPSVGRAHDKAVLSPMNEIGGMREEYVAEWRVPIVAGTMEHDVLAVDLAGEQDRVAVVRGQDDVDEFELLEVIGDAEANAGAVIAVAPGDVIA